MERERRKVILNAPIFRPKATTIVNDKFFREFFKQHPEFRHLRKKYTKWDFKNITTYFNERLAEIAINNRDGVSLPEQLGQIILMSINKAKRKINNKLSNELGMDINYTNNHSDGLLLKINHSSRGKMFNFENKSLWKFKATETFRTKASRAYGEKYHMYKVLDSSKERVRREEAFYKRHGMDLNILENKNRKSIER